MATKIQKFDLEKLSKQLKKAWSPINVGTVDGFVVRMAKFRGRYHWHRIEGEERLLVSVINVAEVYKFLLSNRTIKEAKEFLDFMLKRSFVIPVITQIAVKAAIIKHEKKWGLADAIVAAT